MKVRLVIIRPSSKLTIFQSNEDYIQHKSRSYGDPNFDYRWENLELISGRVDLLTRRSLPNRYGIYPRLRRQSHPLDCSVMQYRGHQVMRTLIRCNFSPAETTGQSYIYSGSSNGYIHVSYYDKSRSRVGLIMSYDRFGPSMGERSRRLTAQRRCQSRSTLASPTRQICLARGPLHDGDGNRRGSLCET